MPLSEKEVPYTGPYSLASGPHRSRGPTAKALKIAAKRMGQEPFAGKDNSEFDEHYNESLEKALDRMTNAEWNGYGEKRWQAMRKLVVPKGLSGAGEYALNKPARDLILTDYAQMKQPAIPDLGPVFSGGKSVLDHDLTHATSGISLYPAFDDAFCAGTTILAPESLEVFRDSSSNPGDAFYAHGASLIDYWFGHLVTAPAVGAKFSKGAKIGVVLDHSVGGGPHTHVGVNVERLLGKGVQLEHHTNYTHGAPTIRTQLERALV